MIPWIAILLGACFGAFTARRKGGGALDMAQYGAGFGILFGLIGLFVAIFIARNS